MPSEHESNVKNADHEHVGVSNNEGFLLSEEAPALAPWRQYSPSLFENRRIDAAANTSVRANVMQQMQQTHGNRSVQRQVQRRFGLTSVQRYQSGSRGHGGVEESAMQDAGFSAEDAKGIYFGNWLRDFSQVPGGLDKLGLGSLKPQLLQVLNIMSLGEFNQEFTDDQLGGYVASEHIDNPEGGGSIDDPTSESNALATRLIDGGGNPSADDLKKLGISQTQWDFYKKSEAQFKEAKKTDKSGLPDYMVRAKVRTKMKLEEAITQGKAKGMATLGDALHTLEDFFSHSNFVSVALTVLQNEKKAPPRPADKQAQLNALLAAKQQADKDLGPGRDTAGEVGPDGKVKPQLVTGTYVEGGNDMVSKIEILRSALVSNEMTKAMQLGIMRKLGITPAQIGQKLAGAVSSATTSVGETVGAVGGAVSGGARGAYSGMMSGWDRNSGFSAVSGALSGLFSGGAEGASKGAAEGAESGREGGAALGAGIVDATSRAFDVTNKSLEEVVDKLGVKKLMSILPELDIQKRAMIAALDAILKAASEAQTKKSAEDTKAKGKALGKEIAGPTHSEISKDAPDNPLFGASTALAKAADTKIGAAVRDIWEATPQAATPQGSSSQAATPQAGPSQAAPPTTSAANGSTASTAGGAQPASPSASDPRIKAVTDMVDKFICDPQSPDRWWEGIILASAQKPKE